MAITWAKGTFTRPTGTGNQTIDSGTGVTGKALILFWTRQTAEGFDETSGHKVMGYGFAASSTQRGCIAIAAEAGVSTTNCGKAYFTNRVIEVFSDSTPTEESVADFVSFGTGGDAGKFTVNWTTNPGAASAIIIHYVFIGGSDVSNAFVGDFTGPGAGATGNRSFTGIGFQGKVLITLNANMTATGTATGISFGLGAAESSTKRWASCTSGNDGQSVGQAAEFFGSISLCLATEKHGSVAGDLASDNKADFVSWGSDGFTLNYTKATTGSIKFLGLVLAGTFAAHVGTFRTFGTSYNLSGPQSVSFGFRPKGALFSGTVWDNPELDAEDIATFAAEAGAFGSSGTQGIAILDYEPKTFPAPASYRTVTNRCQSTQDSDTPAGTGGPEHDLSLQTINDDGFTLFDNTVSINQINEREFQSGVNFLALGDAGQAIPPALGIKYGKIPALRDSSVQEVGQMEITGIGFVPKAVIIIRSRTTDADVWNGNIRNCIGVGTKRGGTVQQGCMHYQSNDNVSTTNTSRLTNNAAVWHNGTNAITLVGFGGSFGSDSFVLGYTAAALEGELLDYVAIGGTDLSDAIVLTPTMNTSGATQAITGAGFKPDCALFLYARTLHVTTLQDHAMMSFGVASSPTDEWCVSTAADDAVTTTGAMDWVKVIRTDACMYSFLTDGTEDAKWNLATFDTDGLTLNIDNLPAASTIAVILCLKGGRFKAGTKGKATGVAPIDDEFTGIGFASAGVLFANTHQTLVNTIEVHENISIFAATSKDGSQEGGEAFVGADATLPTQEDQRSSNAKAIITALHGATPAVQAEADMKSFDSDGFTVTWTTNDGVADIVAYLAFGSQPQIIIMRSM